MEGRYLRDKESNKLVAPYTHPSLVIDDDGKSVEANLGKLAELETENKESVVAAINEVLAKVGEGGTGGPSVYSVVTPAEYTDMEKTADRLYVIL